MDKTPKKPGKPRGRPRTRDTEHTAKRALERLKNLNPDYDLKKELRLKNDAHKSQLSDIVSSIKIGYETIVNQAVAAGDVGKLREAANALVEFELLRHALGLTGATIQQQMNALLRLHGQQQKPKAGAAAGDDADPGSGDDLENLTLEQLQSLKTADEQAKTPVNTAVLE